MTDVSNPFKKEPQQQLSGLSEQAGFEIPVESVSLPSKGSIYPLGHPLCNETEVEIKCMTAKEEDLLTSRALIKNGSVITKLIQSCMMNKTVDPDTLVTGDRNALLIAIRVTGYGSEYGVKIECPDCGEDFENEFSLGTLAVKGLGAEPLNPNTNVFCFTLPKTKREVQFRLLTGAEETELMQESKARKKARLSQVENTITSRLLKSVISIAGETDGSKLAFMIRNMPAADARALRNYVEKVEPSVEMKQKATCPSCSEVSEVDVPLGISFFWPDAG